MVFCHRMQELIFAFLAGLATVAGPCILPLLPIVLGTSTIKRHPARPLAIVLGFTLSFASAAILFSVFGRFLPFTQQSLRYLSAFVIAMFGFILLFPRLQTSIFSKLEPLIGRIGQKTSSTDTEGLGSGFILGLTLGLIWTPCAGPVLGSILALVASHSNVIGAASLLIAYALGAGLPMLAIAYGGQYAVTRVRAIAPYTNLIQRIFGIIMILVAVSIATGTATTIQVWFANTLAIGKAQCSSLL